MARGSNRRKTQEPTITIASTAASGTTGESDSAGSSEKVSYTAIVTTATAGTMTLVIQSSADDGTNWYDLVAAEMSGSTAAISATGTYRISSVGPIGNRTRLKYTIVTGPFAFTVIPVFEKSGNVY